MPEIAESSRNYHYRQNQEQSVDAWKNITIRIGFHKLKDILNTNKLTLRGNTTACPGAEEYRYYDEPLTSKQTRAELENDCNTWQKSW